MIAREWRILGKDPWLFGLVTWLPPLLFFLIWLIMSAGIARNLPVGVVDLDNSSLSRALIRHYDATSALNTDTGFTDLLQGGAALRAGRIYALVVLPADLEKMTRLGRTVQVSAFVNSQFLLIARIINSALLQAHTSFTTKVEIAQNLGRGSMVVDLAVSRALPITTQITPLFNGGGNYAQFLVAAILPAVWQILMVAATVLALSGEQQRQGLQVWLGAAPLRALLAKLLVLATLFSLHGLLFLWFMFILLDWPMHGNWTLLLLAQAMTVAASIAAASLFFFLTQDAARGLSLAAAYTAPGLAFMGVTFPVSDMPLGAQVWRSLLPISHYIEIQLAQVNSGAPLSLAMPQLLHLCFFFPIFLLIFFKAKQLAEAPRKNELA